MGEPKPLASLSAGLLARKGGARPAMRRQGMAGFGQMLTPQDDLGWNDMGYDVNPAPTDERTAQQRIDLTPMLSPIQAVRPVDMDAQAQDAEKGAEEIIVPAPLPEVVRQRQMLAEKMAPRVPLNLGGKQPALRDAAPKAEETPVVAEMPAPAAPASEAPAPEATAPEAAAPVATDLPQRSIPAPGIVAGSMAPAGTTGPRILARTSPRQGASGSKAAFTLRIDPERHLRLRLASAVTRRSAQVILFEALDTYLKSLPEIDALAQQAARKK